MFLPMINNRNPKQTDKFNPYGESHPSSEQFGLGIQVIKIQSSKTIDPHTQKQKRITKNIQNPILEQPIVQGFKRTPILPSLSTDKKAKTGGLNDTFKERKATVEKKKLILPTDSIKQFEERIRPLEKKASSVQQVNKANLIEQTNLVPSQKVIIQKHYRTSMNELLNFYQKFDERQSENLKDIRRLRKGKDINNEEQLAKELKFKQNKIEMVIDMTHKENFSFFEPQEYYDEFSVMNYVDGGCQFKFEDTQPDFQY